MKRLVLSIVFACSTLFMAAQVAIVAHRGYWLARQLLLSN